MILRRVIKHVRNQEWIAIFLDFLIVVMGILIAFQITNWSEAREERTQEQQIIGWLFSDFDAIGREADEMIEFIEANTEEIEIFKQLILNDPKIADLQRVQNFFETSFSLPSPTGQSDTFEQLVASGDMSLLTDDQLRNALVAHASMTRNFLHNDQAIREWGRPYLAPLVRLRLLIEAMPLDEAVSTAGSKADLIVAIGMYQSVFEGHLSMHKTHRESITDLRNMLAKEANP